MRDEITRLAQQYKFFHWHLAFPDVFYVPKESQRAKNLQTGWSGGFDVVVGNPPWERVTIQDKEWFADKAPLVATAGNAKARAAAIADLKISDPAIYQQYVDEKRSAAGEKLLLRSSGLYPLCGCGDVNLFAVSAELDQYLLSDRGSSGLILPTGIATTKTTAPFFAQLASSHRIVSLLDFDNRGGAFPGVQGNVRFCLFTTSARERSATFKCASFLYSAEDIGIAERLYELSLDDLRMINPNTLGCPMFSSGKDANLVRFVYRNIPILAHSDSTQGPWHVELGRMFHMNDDAHMFWTRERLIEAGFSLAGNVYTDGDDSYLPLYESKLAFQFNHRASTFDGISSDQRFGTHPSTVEVLTSQLEDPTFCVLPRYWMSSKDAESKLGPRNGMLSFRNAISVTADSRSLVATILPRLPAGNSLLFIYAEGGSAEEIFLAGCLNSLIVDYILRQKASGGNASLFIIEQLPIIQVKDKAKMSWLNARLLELIYTAWELESFAKDCGWNGPPFRWDEERRFMLRCELDAAFFHLYLPTEPNGDWSPCDNETAEDRARLKASFPTPRHAVAYIMETFPIVRRKDEAAFSGEYRTKRVILEIYDAMVEAMRTGIPYQTRLSPPPADAAVAHPFRVESLAQATVVPNPMEDLKAVANDTWATPVGVSPDNVALFTLIDVLRLIGGPVDSERVRVAAILVRSPAIAIAFMDDDHATEWVRVIGQDARPLAGNVIQISQFQLGTADIPWAEAARQLRGSGGIAVGADGKWSAGARLPLTSGQNWIRGRVAVAVQLLAEIEPAVAERKVIAFIRSVEDGTARRAVS